MDRQRRACLCLSINSQPSTLNFPDLSPRSRLCQRGFRLRDPGASEALPDGQGLFAEPDGFREIAGFSEELAELQGNLRLLGLQTGPRAYSDGFLILRPCRIPSAGGDLLAG